jgi:acetyltransferase-like isoleucine patch superfamily enzyme
MSQDLRIPTSSAQRYDSYPAAGDAGPAGASTRVASAMRSPIASLPARRNPSAAAAKEGMMAKSLGQLIPLSLRSFLKDRLLARKYPTLKFGRNVQIKESSFGRRTQLADNVNIYHCEIGDYSYIETGTVAAYAIIGKFCSIAGGTYIGLGVHPSRDAVSTHPAFYSRSRGLATSFADQDYLEEYAPVRIGNDVWIGTAAVIKGGITIGDGAIIGAGAVVTKNVDPYTIVGGVPAKKIRDRFDGDTIDFLLRFKWWDKDEQWLKANYKHFHNVQQFVAAFRNKA